MNSKRFVANGKVGIMEILWINERLDLLRTHTGIVEGRESM